MSPRVAFLPSGQPGAFPFTVLGEHAEGSWGLVDDRVWVSAAAAAPLELLYLSHPDFLHAMRGLDAAQTSEAVEHRRRTFSSALPARALGEVARETSRCLALIPVSERMSDVATDLLTALASFTTVERLAANPAPVLLDYLREGDAEILAELESPSMRQALGGDIASAERDTRTGFALDLGRIAAGRGQLGKDRALPFADVLRVYVITPPDPVAEKQARFLGNPVRPWRDGILVPLPERKIRAVKLRGHDAAVMFPALGPFLGVLQTCTPAQLDVELADRQLQPGLAGYLDGRRVQQSILRVAARLRVGADAELAGVLEGQTRLEASLLPGWLSRPAAATLSIADIPTELHALVETATLLGFLCRAQKQPSRAAKIDALARALSHVEEDMRS